MDDLGHVSIEQSKTDDGDDLVNSPAIHQRDDAEGYGEDGLQPGESSGLLPDLVERLEDVPGAIIDLIMVELARGFTGLCEKEQKIHLIISFKVRSHPCQRNYEVRQAVLFV